MRAVRGSFVLGVIVMMFASVGFAGEGPEILTLPASKGAVDFTHWQHQVNLNDDCSKCHPDDPGKISAMGRDWAHQICQGCHIKTAVGAKKGPTLCFGCHNKPQ